MENEFLKLEINPKGAELSSIYIKSKNQELIWSADQAIWARHAPVLFPIVGKLKNDTYQIEEKIYKLKQHGFARDLVHNKKAEGEYELISNAETKQNYPFDFLLITKYKLEKNIIVINYEVRNLSTTIMPFSLGAHPGFNVQNKKNVKVQFEKEESEYYLLNNGLVDFSKDHKVERSLKLNADSFKNDALIFKELKSSWVKLYDGDKADDLVLTMHFKNLPYFGIWSKFQNELSFVCLEPWWGIADTLNGARDIKMKEGINLLSPNSSMTFEFSLEVNI